MTCNVRPDTLTHSAAVALAGTGGFTTQASGIAHYTYTSHAERELQIRPTTHPASTSCLHIHVDNMSTRQIKHKPNANLLRVPHTEARLNGDNYNCRWDCTEHPPSKQRPMATNARTATSEGTHWFTTQWLYSQLHTMFSTAVTKAPLPRLPRTGSNQLRPVHTCAISSSIL